MAGQEMTNTLRPASVSPDPGESGSPERKQVLQTVLQLLRPLRGFPVWARYGLATVIILACALLHRGMFGDHTVHPYLLFFPAIILASFAFDRGTGFYATLLSAALSWSRGTSAGLGSAVELGLFTSVGLFCAAAIEALRLMVDEPGKHEGQLERDLENRKRAEAALAESEARFRATFELAAAGVARRA